MVLSNIEGNPILELKELRKLQLRGKYDEKLVKSIMETSRAVRVLKIE